MSRSIRPVLACLAGALLLACAPSAPKVKVPPRIDLHDWKTIGIVGFTGDVESELTDLATARFVQMLHHAQPGARILELGPEGRVLRRIGHTELDFEALREIGEHYEVDAVFAGSLAVSHVKPRFRLGEGFSSIHARADVNGQLATKLVETRSGAAVWSRASTATANVAHVGVMEGAGSPTFGANDPSDAYLGLVRQLVSNVSGDFYPTWRRP